MKKRLLVCTMCLLGIGYVSAQLSMREQVIILTEVITCSPLDDNLKDDGRDRPDPTQFRATQDENTITAKADTEDIAHVAIRNQATGTTIVNQDFWDETTIVVPAKGTYTISITSGGTTVEGQFKTN